MEKLRYESHGLEQKLLPIIHLKNDIGPVLGEIANWHDNLELLFCLEGRGKVLCGGRSWEFTPGDLITVNCNAIHRISADRRLCYRVLIVDSGFLMESGIGVRELDFETLVRSEVIRGLFSEYAQALEWEEPYRAAAVRGAVLRLVATLARDHARRCPGEPGIADAGVKQAIAYIRENYSRQLTLEQVADRAGLSKYHFSRVFKRATGMTLTRYINTVRCEQARKLLARGDRVSQAAPACGFENLSYFSATFRSLTGSLPSEAARAEAGKNGS